MGNKLSRRKRGGTKCKYGPANQDLNEDVENYQDYLKETDPDSYNKLFAWMVEMAENDDADPNTTEYVEHITTRCAQKHRYHSRLDMQMRQQSFECYLEVPRNDEPVRQHSVESTSSSKNSRSTRSREELLDPKTRFRRSQLSRQKTVDYSDDGDITGVSGGESFDQDDAATNKDSIMINRYTETSFIRDPFRPPLLKTNSCNTYRNISPSIGDLLNVQSRRKSKSLMTMRKMLSEAHNDEDIAPITEETVTRLLDDCLLDGNLADILYSVEALWPKYPNMSN